jgi:hypothetical protein
MASRSAHCQLTAAVRQRRSSERSRASYSVCPKLVTPHRYPAPVEITVRTASSAEERLVNEIDRVRPRCDRYVVVEAMPYYVQLMPNHGSIYGEVVSNAYLTEGYRLNLRQDRRLVQLGWGRPGQSCHPECPSRSHRNYTRIWGSGVPSREIARYLLHGLMVVCSTRGEGGSALVVKSNVRITQATEGVVPGH